MKESKRINYQFIVNKLFYLFGCLGLSDETMSKRISLSIALKCLVWARSEGRPGIERFKALSNACIRAIMGLKLDRSLPYKFPRVFLRAVELSRSSHLARLYWISVFNFHRLVVMKPDYSVSTITGRFSGNLFRLVSNSKLWTSLSTTCSVFSKTFGIKTIKGFNLRWSISGSAGPNGSPAFQKFPEDVYAVCRSSLLVKIFCLYKLLPVINRKEVNKVMSDLILWVWENSSKFKGKNPLHSRLAFLSDKGGKTRVVAIVDILSQSILKPVHDHVNNILRIIPMDGTFDQDKQRARVKSWSEKELFTSSIDLSSCTDRFPGLLQALILWKCNALTLWQAFWWLQVIAKRTFTARSSEGTLDSVRYRVGQPMGALSSWPVMALCHHVLVQLSYSLAYPKSVKIFTDYALLGDDLVIRDKKVAESYKEVISSFGMEWSPSKSFEAEGLSEFAKSLFRSGEDLKPFPLALLTFRKNTFVSDTIALVKELSDRKFRISYADFVGLWKEPRSRKLATLAMLSPSSLRSCLPEVYRPHWDDYSTFESLLLSKRVSHFLKIENLFEYTHAFALSDPTDRKVLGNPCLQIGLDNSSRYPVRYLEGETNRSSKVLVGLGWTAYDPECWPEGLPHLSDRKFIPGPSWKRNTDDVIHRSTLIEMNSLVPGYFWPSCSRKSWRR